MHHILWYLNNNCLKKSNIKYRNTVYTVRNSSEYVLHYNKSDGFV